MTTTIKKQDYRDKEGVRDPLTGKIIEAMVFILN
jgi:hypothetical protein